MRAFFLYLSLQTKFVGTHEKHFIEMIPMSEWVSEWEPQEMFSLQNIKKSQFFKGQDLNDHDQLHVSIHNNEIVCCRELSVDHDLDLHCFQKSQQD